MLHWYSKVTIILRKIKNAKETIIVRRREYLLKIQWLQWQYIMRTPMKSI